MVIERSRQDNTRGWVAKDKLRTKTGGMRQFAGSFASSTTTSVFEVSETRGW